GERGEDGGEAGGVGAQGSSPPVGGRDRWRLRHPAKPPPPAAARIGAAAGGGSFVGRAHFSGCPDASRSIGNASSSFRFALISRIVCSRRLAGLKLGGVERGGYSLNVAVNLKTSSIMP